MSKNEMSIKAARAISTIKKLLTEEDIVGFKIGKTDDCIRREDEYKAEGYTQLIPLVELESLEKANQLETKLISVYREDKRCNNKREGGGGNISPSNRYFVYIAIK
ncbi:MAG: hypothetical protein IKY64_04035 [Bacteroidaceae bacterium]|nr:hypothetical protein [Bacteroidaceae bacterium]